MYYCSTKKRLTHVFTTPVTTSISFLLETAILLFEYQSSTSNHPKGERHPPLVVTTHHCRPFPIAVTPGSLS